MRGQIQRNLSTLFAPSSGIKHDYSESKTFTNLLAEKTFTEGGLYLEDFVAIIWINT